MQKSYILSILISLVIIGGCSHSIKFIDFDKGDIILGSYGPGRDISVTMPDGEVLEGEYSAASNASFSFGAATAYSYSATATGTGYGINSGGTSQAYALLKSTKSKLMMEVLVTYSEWSGHGFGEARTNDGRKFKVQF